MTSSFFLSHVKLKKGMGFETPKSSLSPKIDTAYIPSSQRRLLSFHFHKFLQAKVASFLFLGLPLNLSQNQRAHSCLQSPGITRHRFHCSSLICLRELMSAAALPTVTVLFAPNAGTVAPASSLAVARFSHRRSCSVRGQPTRRCCLFSLLLSPPLDLCLPAAVAEIAATERSRSRRRPAGGLPLIRFSSTAVSQQLQTRFFNPGLLHSSRHINVVVHVIEC